MLDTRTATSAFGMSESQASEDSDRQSHSSASVRQARYDAASLLPCLCPGSAPLAASRLHGETVTCLSFHPNGRRGASGAAESKVRSRTEFTERLPSVPPVTASSIKICHVTASPLQVVLFELGASLGSIKPVAEQSTAAAGGEVGGRPGAADIAFRQDGRLLAVAWCVAVAPVGPPDKERVGVAGRRALRGLTRPNGHFLRSWDGRVRLFDAKQGKPLASLKYHAKARRWSCCRRHTEASKRTV